MRNNIKELAEAIETSTNFLFDWEAKLPNCGSLHADARLCIFMRHDAAEVGEAFGRHGWKRKKSYGDSYDWEKTVNGVRLLISNAEDIQMNDEVPEKAFPLLIKDAEAK